MPALAALTAAGLREQGAHKGAIFDEAFWRWQYAELPTGVAHVYVTLLGDEIAGYYHVPVYEVRCDGQRRFAGVVQDVAVSATLRGQGVFRRLAEYATDDLGRSGLDFAYTFPNANSIRTFLAYTGYAQVATLGAWVLPVRTAPLLASKLPIVPVARWLGGAVDAALRVGARRPRRSFRMELHGKADDELATVFAPLERPGAITLHRSAAYLDWRFFRRPASRYFVFSMRDGGRIIAAAVFKQDAMFGLPALLLMDGACAPGHDDDLSDLIVHVARGAHDHAMPPFDVVFFAGQGDGVTALRRAGFFKVPAALNPRPLHLLTRGFALERPAVLAGAAAWRVTLTDWDVF